MECSIMKSMNRSHRMRSLYARALCNHTNAAVCWSTGGPHGTQRGRQTFTILQNTVWQHHCTWTANFVVISPSPVPVKINPLLFSKCPNITVVIPVHYTFTSSAPIACHGRSPCLLLLSSGQWPTTSHQYRIKHVICSHVLRAVTVHESILLVVACNHFIYII